MLIADKAPIDSVLSYLLEIGNYDFFTPDNFNIKSMLQSGDLKLIDFRETKKELLRMLKTYDYVETMQNNFLQALDDNYFPILLKNLDMTTFQAINPSFFIKQR